MCPNVMYPIGKNNENKLIENKSYSGWTNSFLEQQYYCQPIKVGNIPVILKQSGKEEMLNTEPTSR